MTAEHDPYEAGVGFAVRMDKSDFLGKSALAELEGRTPERKLVPLLLDHREYVVMGKEPVHADGSVAGYVTSAADGYTIDRSIAYAAGGVLVPSEHHIGAFHDWVRTKIGDAPPTAA